jgi:hypothetical protein
MLERWMRTSRSCEYAPCGDIILHFRRYRRRGRYLSILPNKATIYLRGDFTGTERRNYRGMIEKYRLFLSSINLEQFVEQKNGFFGMDAF